MAETINNFGRTAVRAIAQNLYMQKKVPESISSKSNGTADAGISIDFQGYTFDATEYTTSTVIKLLATFNSHWHLQENKKNNFMITFSIAEWKKPTLVQQAAGHTIKQCHTCQTRYQLTYFSIASQTNQ